MGKDFYCAATVSLANKKLFWMSGGFRSVRKLIDPTRPYLHVHENAGEREMQVINLTGSHVITSPEVEMLLKASPLTRHRSRMKIAFCADKEKKKNSDDGPLQFSHLQIRISYKRLLRMSGRNGCL